MQIAFALTTLVTLLLPLSAHASSAAKCTSLFQQSRWQHEYELIFSPFQARSLLPQEYLKEIESKYGALNFEIITYDGMTAPVQKLDSLLGNKEQVRIDAAHFTVSVRAQSKGSEFSAQIDLIYSRLDRTKVIINNLFISDRGSNSASGLRSSSDSSQRLHQTQVAGGANIHLLNETLENIFTYLKSRNIQTAEIAAASDYTVSLLYRKLLGFRPSSEKSRIVYEAMDQAYRNSKKLPDHLKPKSVDEFARSLGYYRSEIDAFELAYFALQRFLKGLPVDSRTQIVLDENQRPIAVVLDSELIKQADFTRKNPNGKNVFYIDPIAQQSILFWKSAATNRGLELQRPVN